MYQSSPAKDTNSITQIYTIWLQTCHNAYVYALRPKYIEIWIMELLAYLYNLWWFIPNIVSPNYALVGGWL